MRFLYNSMISLMTSSHGNLTQSGQRAVDGSTVLADQRLGGVSVTPVALIFPRELVTHKLVALNAPSVQADLHSGSSEAE